MRLIALKSGPRPPPTLLWRKELSSASLKASVHIKLLLLYSHRISAHLYLCPRARFNSIYPFLVLSCFSLTGTFVETFPLIPPLLPALKLSSPLPSPAFYFPVLPPSALISTFLHLSPLPSFSPFIVQPLHAVYTLLLFADLFNLLNPFPYSRCNFFLPGRI